MDYEQTEHRNTGCLQFIVVIIVIYLIFKFLGGTGKYEGESAEYWFNEYDSISAQYEDLKTCVQDNPHDAENQCL